MILFLDDETRRTTIYAEELRLSGYGVHCENEIDSAWAFFQEHSGQIELLILDIMMPPGSTGLWVEGVDTVINTGVAFYKRVREVAPACPVIIFSNVADSELPDYFEGENNCWFYPKAELMPFELAEEVKNILSPHGDEGGGRKGR